jgi:uncharacterized integral membrane protein
MVFPLFFAYINKAYTRIKLLLGGPLVALICVALAAAVVKILVRYLQMGKRLYGSKVIDRHGGHLAECSLVMPAIRASIEEILT